MPKEQKKLIVFTKHALQRARQRKLWKYVSKEKFYFDASYNGFNTAKLEDCVYAFKYVGNETIILTMFRA
jgi:hypothetical protein